MNHYELAGKPFSIPSFWSEISLNTFLKISKCTGGDLSAMLEIITGITKQEWDDAPLSPLELEMITEALSWMREPLDASTLHLPAVVKIMAKSVPVPLDLSVQPYGAYQYLSQKIEELCGRYKAEDGKEYYKEMPVDLVPHAIAAYLKKPYDNKPFSTDDMSDMLELVGELPITEAYPIASFFLRNHLGLNKEIQRSSTHTTLIRKRQEAQPSLNSET